MGNKMPIISEIQLDDYTIYNKLEHISDSPRYELSQLEIHDFSSNTRQSKQISSLVQEGKVVRSSEELRIQIEKPIQCTYQMVQGQLIIQFDNQKYYIGSGTVNLIYSDHNSDKRSFVLTCAHNFYNQFSGVEKKVIQFLKGEFHYNQISENQYFDRQQIQGYCLYPGYINNTQPSSGLDFAIAVLENQMFENKNCPQSENSSWHYLDEEVKAGDEIMIIGYPGEYSGALYQMNGTIKQIKQVGENQIIIYNDINTTKGQSGSPIYHKRGINWSIIGVHVAYDESIECNIGTGITFEMYQWMVQTAKKLLNK